MKTVQVRALSQDLLPQMPGDKCQGMMLYASPSQHVLRWTPKTGPGNKVDFPWFNFGGEDGW